jgi:CRISPR-associated endonuclease Csn1
LRSPWHGCAEVDDFRRQAQEAIRIINVSHRPTRKVSGALHEETNYGPTSEKNTYVYRKPLAALTLKMVQDDNCIRDKTVRDLIRERLDEKGIDWRNSYGKMDMKKAFPDNEPLCLPNKNGAPVPIRTVRIELRESGLVPFKDRNTGKAYRFAPTGENHHVEIFEWEENGRKVREVVGVSLFEAAQRVRRREPVFRKNHPLRPDAKLYIALCKNDMVKLRNEEGKWELCRVQKMSATGAGTDLHFRLHTASTIESDSTLRRVRSVQPGKFEVRLASMDILG